MARKHPEIVATIVNKMVCENCGHTTKGFFLLFSIPRLLMSMLCYIGVGKKVRVDIKRWYKKRTNKQNATSWGPDYNLIVAFILTETGDLFTSEQLHDFHKSTFLGFDECELAKGLKKPKSTTDLTTVEYNELFRERYCKFWAERGLYIPDPVKDENK
jgi:hypothetical protein